MEQVFHFKAKVETRREKRIRKLSNGRGPGGEVGACIQGFIYRQEFQMVIETGNTVTMMNQKTWNQLKKPGMLLMKTTMWLFTLDGTETPSYGKRTFLI